MWNKPAADVTIGDIQELIDQKVDERLTIEFKRERWKIDPIPRSVQQQERGSKEDYRNGQIHEFLKDCTAFANAVGGYIVTGVRSGNGLPCEIEGEEVSNVDAVKQVMNALIQERVEPRIVVDINALPTSQNKYLFVIRIAESTLGPHQIVKTAQPQFYRRTSSGASYMTNSEIREAFTFTESVYRKMAHFVEHRKTQIANGDVPAHVKLVRPYILHAVPYQAFATRTELPGVVLKEKSDLFSVYRNELVRPKINFDGIVLHFGRKDYMVDRYLQVFRNGIIEIAASCGVRPHESNGTLFLSGGVLAHDMTHLMERNLGALMQLGIMPPYWMFLAIRDLKGTWILEDSRRSFRNSSIIDRTHIKMPEREVREISRDVGSVAKEWFDLLWNAGGLDKCYLFNDDGSFAQ